MHVRVYVHRLHSIDVAGLFHLMGVSVQASVLVEDDNRAGAKLRAKLGFKFVSPFESLPPACRVRSDLQVVGFVVEPIRPPSDYLLKPG